MAVLNDSLFSGNYMKVYKKAEDEKRKFNWKNFRNDSSATGGGFQKVHGPFVLPAGMKIWKLTQNPLGLGDQKVSPWWCARDPYKEQQHGIEHEIATAIINSVPFNIYVRVASCVKVEWNTLDKLQVIKLQQPAKALWGKFEPMHVHDKDSESSKYWKESNSLTLEKMKQAGYDPEKSDAILGGLGCYQLFIPGLQGKHVTKILECQADDNEVLKNYFDLGTYL